MYPYVITTYRLTEHHVSEAMTRWLPWLSELQPELFAEISKELAAEKGVKNGDWITLWTDRSEVEAKALVTERITPLRIDGRIVHQIGLPYHWGYKGVVTGDVVNDLLLLVADRHQPVLPQPRRVAEALAEDHDKPDNRKTIAPLWSLPPNASPTPSRRRTGHS